jgi:hypothetical protein
VIVFVAVVPMAAIGPVLMLVAVIVMAMIVVVMAVVVMIVMIVIAMVGALLGLERALHGDGDATLAARQLREGGAVLDIESVAGKFGKTMLATKMPGETHEAERVLGTHLEQFFGRSLHLDERPILQPEGVAVIDGGRHVEIEMDLGTGLTGQMRMALAARRMVERDRIDHAIRFHGGFADDGGDAGHGVSRANER